MYSTNVIDRTMRLTEVAVEPLASLTCGALVVANAPGDELVIIVATAHGTLHVVSNTSHRMLAFVSCMDGVPSVHRRSPIVALRCGVSGALFVLQSPSNRILQIDVGAVVCDTLVRQIVPGMAAINALSLSTHDEKDRVVIGGADGRALLWDTTLHAPIWSTDPGDDAVTLIALDPHEPIMLVAHRSGCVQGRRCADGSAVGDPWQPAHGPSTVAAYWRGRTGAIMFSATGQATAFDMFQGHIRTRVEWAESDAVICAAVTADGSTIAVGLVSGLVVIRSIKTPTASVLAQRQLSSAIVVLSFMDEGIVGRSPRLIVAEYDGGVEIWPLKPDELVPTKTTVTADDGTVDSMPTGTAFTPIPDPCPLAPASGSELHKPRSGPIPVAEKPPSVLIGPSCSRVPDDPITPSTAPVPASSPYAAIDHYSIPAMETERPETVTATVRRIDAKTGRRPLANIPVGKFSSQDKISTVLRRSSSPPPADCDLGTATLNSSLWIKHRIKEIAMTSLIKAPVVDASVVYARAASKALHYSIMKKDVFGELPSLDVDLPPPIRRDLPKQIDPKWIQSLDRRPDIHAHLRPSDTDPEMSHVETDWPFSATDAVARLAVPDEEPMLMMSSVLQRQLHYWRHGEQALSR